MARSARKPAAGGIAKPADVAATGNIGASSEDGGGAASDRTIDPAKLGSAGSDPGGTAGGDSDTGKRGRGRPRGARTGTKRAPLDLADFADILLMVHAGLSVAFRSELIKINEDEAGQLARAAQNVARHYDMPGIAQETKDWVGLITAVGAVYGPRITAAWMDRAAKAPPAPREQTADQIVVPFKASGNPGERDGAG